MTPEGAYFQTGGQEVCPEEVASGDRPGGQAAWTPGVSVPAAGCRKCVGVWGAQGVWGHEGVWSVWGAGGVRGVLDWMGHEG